MHIIAYLERVLIRIERQLYLIVIVELYEYDTLSHVGGLPIDRGESFNTDNYAILHFESLRDIYVVSQIYKSDDIICRKYIFIYRRKMTSGCNTNTTLIIISYYYVCRTRPHCIHLRHYDSKNVVHYCLSQQYPIC